MEPNYRRKEMGILERFTTIVKSNVNAMLDKAEDPEKMVDQSLVDMRENLAEVKKNTAKIMAEEKRTKDLVEECKTKIETYGVSAKNALIAGNEEDARTLIAQKQSEESKLVSLQQSYDVAHTNAVKMRQMHDKLVSDIKELENRKASIKAKVSVAKAQNSVAEAMSSVNSEGSISAFERMSDKADRMLAESEAQLELNKDMQESSADDLVSKYASGASNVDDELEKMKSSLGL